MPVECREQVIVFAVESPRALVLLEAEDALVGAFGHVEVVCEVPVCVADSRPEAASRFRPYALTVSR